MADTEKYVSLTLDVYGYARSNQALSTADDPKLRTSVLLFDGERIWKDEKQLKAHILRQVNKALRGPKNPYYAVIHQDQHDLVTLHPRVEGTGWRWINIVEGQRQEGENSSLFDGIMAALNSLDTYIKTALQNSNAKKLKHYKARLSEVDAEISAIKEDQSAQEMQAANEPAAVNAEGNGHERFAEWSNG